MNESKRNKIVSIKYSTESCDSILEIPPKIFSQTNLPIQYYIYLKFSTSLIKYKQQLHKKEEEKEWFVKMNKKLVTNYYNRKIIIYKNKCLVYKGK